MKICHKCFGALEDNDLYCSNCGKKYDSKQRAICPMCKKYLVNTHPVCDNCYTNIQGWVGELHEQREKLEDKLDMEYKRLAPYVNKIFKMAQIFEQYYYYSSFLPDEIKIDPPTYKEYLEGAINDLKEYIDEKTRIYRHMLHDYGDIKYLTELKIYRDEVSSMAEKYPIFKEAFDTTQIDNIISMYE